MRYGSMFSGIEAASVAWKPLGWQCQWVCEIDAFPSSVLAHHYPDVPNLGDVTKVDWESIRATRPVDLLVFGSPCQSFSVAGKRLGLDDPRGNLALHALSVVGRLRPRWFLFENVPGLLSSGGGRDFGQFLATVGDIGYQCAWRVLDAQYFGVAQRRRRVFVVGHLGDWRRAAAVLFERASLSGHPAPRREAGQKPAPTLGAGPVSGGRTYDTDADSCESLVPHTVGALCDGAHIGGGLTGRTRIQGASLPCVANPLTALMAKGINTTCDEGQTLIPGQIGGAFDGPTHSLRADGFDASEDGTGRGTPLVPVAYALNSHAGVADGGQTNRSHANGGPVGFGLAENVAYSLRAGRQQTVAHAFDARQSDVIQYGDKTGPLDTDGSSIGVMTLAFDTTRITSAANYSNPKPGGPCHPLASTAHPPAIAQHMAVRRLTPRECERLQGFPDGWTDVPYRGKPAADGPRYKALGNSMAVPCMRWIGERIAQVEAL